MGRAFEYRKATKLKRWGHMARTFTKIGKQITEHVAAAAQRRPPEEFRDAMKRRVKALVSNTNGTKVKALEAEVVD